MVKAPPTRQTDHFIMRTSRNGIDLEVEVSGALGQESAHHLEEMITYLAGSLDQIVVDLTRVSSIDADGLISLVRSSEAVEARGARMTLRALPATESRLLDLSGLNSKFEFIEQGDDHIVSYEWGGAR